MNREDYVLFVDETGTASPADTRSRFYILAGCVVLERDRQSLKNWSERIKYKYWNNTEIVFHSREIWRKENDFRVLGRAKTFTAFLADMDEYFSSHKFYMFYAVVDKDVVRAQGWNDIKVYKEVSHSIIKNFLCFLLANNAKGKMVIESADAQKDFYFHKALGRYLSGGIPDLGIAHEKVKDTLTSISFVTKKNFDIEEQIADLFAYGAKVHHMQQIGEKVHEGDYEKFLLAHFKKTTLTPAKMKAFPKQKFAKHIKTFDVIS